MATLTALAIISGLTLVEPSRALADPAGTTEVTLATTEARTDVPLEGFLPFAPEFGATEQNFSDNALPTTMEWFYLPLNEVVVGEGQYDWSEVERKLTSIQARGHQSVLRFYIDYPGRESGLPQYLLDSDVEVHQYDFHGNDNKSVAPNYDDPRVMSMMTNFITEFGKKYDGDPRIGYITTGLIGFWGEQHTWPLNGQVEAINPDGISWMPSADNQSRIYATWAKSFTKTHLHNRYPSRASADLGIGFHDDSFAYSTLPTTDWHFLSAMNEEGLQDHWKVAPVGGELYPPIQECIFSVPLSCSGANEEIAGGRDYNVPEAIEQSHATWIINHRGYTIGYTGEDRERALASHARLGSDLAVTSATIERTKKEKATVTFAVNNRGVAPFAYDWPVRVVLLDAKGTPVSESVSSVKLSSVLPGEAATATAELSIPDGVDGGTISLFVPNPMENGAPLKFANVTQDADAEGYLSLAALPKFTTAAPAAEETKSAGVPSETPDAAQSGPKDSTTTPPSAESTPQTVQPTQQAQPKKAGDATATPAAKSLPRTGVEMAVPAGLATALLLAGLGLVMLARKKASQV